MITVMVKVWVALLRIRQCINQGATTLYDWEEELCIRKELDTNAQCKLSCPFILNQDGINC